MPAEPRYELVLARPHATAARPAAEYGALVPRAVLAAALSPVLSYWLPSRALPWLAERGAIGDLFLTEMLIVAVTLGGAYAAMAVSMRVRRISELAPPVAPIEQLLVALLGVLTPTIPVWFGISSGGGAAQWVAIQAATVFLAVLVLGGAVGDAPWLPPIMVGTIQPPRDLAVRAMVAALLPTALLFVLLPAVVVDVRVDAMSGGVVVNVEGRVLATWVGATLVGMAVGTRAWRDGAPLLLRMRDEAAIAVGAVALAAVVWELSGGLEAPPVVLLVQPVAIFAAMVVLSDRTDREAVAVVPPPPPAPSNTVDPLLVPSAGSTFIGRTQTPYENADTGAKETRIEARWMVPRPFGLVIADYRGRDDLVVRRETATELVLSRTGLSPAAVRITAQPLRPAAPDGPPVSPRTEVRVRVAVSAREEVPRRAGPGAMG